MIKTQCRVRTNDGTYKLVDVVAGVKVAGYAFLIHASITPNRAHDRFSATYAPIGIGIADYESIAELIAALDNKADLIEKAIGRHLREMAETEMPLLAPECGIETLLDRWQDREQFRFDNGDYLPVPQVAGLSYPKVHYLHLSVTKTESDFVAYTPSEAYGQADRQTRLKFGKYLRKTFPDMSDSEVQAAVVALRAKLALTGSPATLKFATDRATINDIFETEMYACDSNYTSCMHSKFAGRDVRPYHVYADSPDVAVAYVVEHGAIVARSVVSTKDKEWVRCYSIKPCDSTYCGVLENLLTAQGYESGDIIGNRLTKLPSRNGEPQLPYIDCGGLDVDDDGKYWIVRVEGEGEYTCDQTDGTATQNGTRCSSCERREDDCECIYCECCDERYQDGCDTCSMCEECDRCIEHERCQCARCSECNRLISPNSRHTRACNCDRCGECGELESECECDKCEECRRLTEDCECTKEESVPVSDSSFEVTA